MRVGFWRFLGVAVAAMAAAGHAVGASLPTTAVQKKPVAIVKPATAMKRPPLKGVVAKPAVVQLPAVPAELPPLTAAQLQLAEQVYLGNLSCELGAHVTLTANPDAAGRFFVVLGGQRYHMEPVATTTGAVRLEDTHEGAVWLQLANKSMLMSQKLGKRLADDCTTPEQAEVARVMTRNPAPSMLDPRGANVALPASAGPDGVATK